MSPLYGQKISGGGGRGVKGFTVNRTVTRISFLVLLLENERYSSIRITEQYEYLEVRLFRRNA